LDGRNSDIAYLNNAKEIHLLTEEKEIIQKFDTTINEPTLEELPSLFKKIYGNEIDLTQQTKEPLELELMASISSTELALALSSVFSGPSHFLPPPTALYDKFMSLLLSKKDNIEPKEIMLIEKKK